MPCSSIHQHHYRYVLAGNHDHYGNVSAEIAYTGLSPRWTFPNYYYTEVFNFNTAAGPKTFQIVFIDTVLLAGLASHDDTFGALPGPADADVALTQWQWINETLGNSTADYLWVAGHYPVWSVCEHGPTDILVAILNPMLQKYKATGYMSGHDHCRAYQFFSSFLPLTPLIEEYINDNKGPVYVLTGTGMSCCYNATHINDIPAGSLKFSVTNSTAPATMIGGFASMTVSDAYMTATWYDQAGNSLYTTPQILPRSL